MAQGFTFDIEMMVEMLSAKELMATELINLAKVNKDIFFITCDNTLKGSKPYEFKETLSGTVL